MAITITVSELAAALHLGDSDEETAEVTRLLGYVSEAVGEHLGDAYAACPDVVVTEAARRLAGYLFDMPEAGRGEHYGNSIRNSGCGRILLPYRVHRAAAAGGDLVAMAQGSVGTTGNPVVDVSYSGDLLTVTYGDGGTEEFTIAGGSGVDQTARDSAQTAQTRADAAYTKAEGAESTAEAAEGTADTTETGLEDHIAQHPGAVQGGPATFEAPRLLQEFDLTNNYQEVFSIPASNFTAGKRYRVTSTSFARGIGAGVHTLMARMYLGTVIITQPATSVDPEGNSQGKWAGTIDRLLTMPDPPVAISMSYLEAGIVRVQLESSLIVMEIS